MRRDIIHLGGAQFTERSRRLSGHFSSRQWDVNANVYAQTLKGHLSCGAQGSGAVTGPSREIICCLSKCFFMRTVYLMMRVNTESLSLVTFHHCRIWIGDFRTPQLLTHSVCDCLMQTGIFMETIILFLVWIQIGNDLPDLTPLIASHTLSEQKHLSSSGCV